VQRGCFRTVNIKLSGKQECTEHELTALHRIGIYKQPEHAVKNSNEANNDNSEEDDHFQQNQMKNADSENKEYHCNKELRLVALKKFRTNQEMAIDMYTKGPTNASKRSENVVNSSLMKKYYSKFFPLGELTYFGFSILKYLEIIHRIITVNDTRQFFMREIAIRKHNNHFLRKNIISSTNELKNYFKYHIPEHVHIGMDKILFLTYK
jgi:hypothetical protein